jgi:hypothetical protein
VPVPHWEWAALASESARLAHLATALAAAGYWTVTAAETAAAAAAAAEADAETARLAEPRSHTASPGWLWLT